MAEIRKLFDARKNFAITLNSLGAGAGRQSDFETNTDGRPAAHVAVEIKPNVAPTADTIYTIYLLRNNGDIVDDDVGLVNAAYTPINAQILGTLRNPGNANIVAGIFDTAFLGALGESWAIAVVNETNQALAAAGNKASFQYYVPEIV